VNLGRTNFIDEIIRREESQASVGFQAIPRKISTVIRQAAGSPSVAYVEIKSQVGVLGPYNTSDYPITIVVVPLINIVVPLLSPYCYYYAP